MNKLSKEKRDRLILIAIASSVFSLALYFLAIGAQQAELAQLAIKIGGARDSVDKAERWLRMAESIRADLDTNLSELEKRHEQMAPIDKFKWFYDTFDSFRSGYEVTLVDITREPEISDVGTLPQFPYQAAAFGVRLNANYHELGRFLADLENRFPYFRIRNLRLELDPALKTPVSTNGIAGLGPEREKLSATLKVVTLVKPSMPL